MFCDLVESTALATVQGFPFWAAVGTILRGWALAYHLKNSRLKVHALPGCHNEGTWA
jgi:hypothetical protein